MNLYIFIYVWLYGCMVVCNVNVRYPNMYIPLVSSSV